MNTENKVSRILGFAFLFQFFTSFSSALFLQPALIVPGDIQITMSRIAERPLLMRANILVDMLTALGVIFLGVMLFQAMRRQNQNMARVALGFYFLEAALLAASRLEAFALLRYSQEYASLGSPAILQTLASLSLESMAFVGGTLHMLAFCAGGLLFYFLLYQSGAVPRALSLWGLLAVIPCLVGTLFAVFGSEIPFAFYLPYVPFELVMGLWILVKGMKVHEETGSYLQLLPVGGKR